MANVVRTVDVVVVVGTFEPVEDFDSEVDALSVTEPDSGYLSCG